MKRHTVVLLAAITWAGCGPASDTARQADMDADDGIPTVEDVRVMVTGFEGDAALYAEIGSATGDSLTSIVVEGASATLHQMAHEDGTMTMVPVPGLAVSASEGLSLRTGGAHGMLHALSPDVAPGDSIGVTFHFASGHDVAMRALVISVSDMLPGGDAGHAH